MRWTLSTAALFAGLLSPAQAQYLANELSFGYGVRYEGFIESEKDSL